MRFGLEASKRALGILKLLLEHIFMKPTELLIHHGASNWNEDHRAAFISWEDET